MSTIIDHNYPIFVRKREKWANNPVKKPNLYNGGYYYSIEIVDNIIPLVKTDRNWMTVDVKPVTIDHCIAFVHNNIHVEWYEKWKGKDVILVCGMPETVERVKNFGKALYLPLSVDVDYVKQFKTKKTKEICFVGRKEKLRGIPNNVDILTGMPREDLLKEVAKYKKAYAVDRCAIEAKILGCEILPYDYNYGVVHDPSFWKVFDNKDAAKMLQEMIDEIDGTRE